MSRGRGGRVNTEALLFGNILGVQPVDVAVATGVAVGFAVLLFASYKSLVFTTFDPAVAAVQGVRAGVMEVVFNLLVASVIIVSVRVLGVLLIAAAVVIPAGVARLVTRSFGAMIGVAVLVSLSATVGGLYLSFHVDVASGASIVLVEAAIFALVALGTAVAARLTLIGARTRARATGADSATLAPPTSARESSPGLPGRRRTDDQVTPLR